MSVSKGQPVTDWKWSFAIRRRIGAHVVCFGWYEWRKLYHWGITYQYEYRHGDQHDVDNPHMESSYT